MNSHITYEDLYKSVTSSTTATLEIESSWEDAVKQEIKDFEKTVGTNVMNLFINTPPRALVKIPKEVYPKDKLIEDFFLDNFAGYFNSFKRELDCETFWGLIHRFLGNDGNYFTLLHFTFFVLCLFNWF